MFLTYTITNVILIYCNKLFKCDSLFVRVVGASAHSSVDMVGLRQQFPGTIKKVSPFFTLYKAVPWRLQSHVYGPFAKVVLFATNHQKIPHETVNDPLQELGATGGQFIPVATQQDDEQNVFTY